MQLGDCGCGTRLLKAAKIDIGAKRVNVRAETKTPAEFADALDLRLDPAVIKSRIEFEDHLSIGAFAFDLPDELVFRPKTFSFVLFRCDRHEIRQNNLS